ncbi:hypothetical protein SCUCBS95973_003348 [Sporothrix curviconia]|uniref:Pal1 cell morphology protein n=1 Tax=Sporothrix curviconia TaxID=1260050 RepID=A0ABP0BEK2_9PEZI
MSYQSPMPEASKPRPPTDERVRHNASASTRKHQSSRSSRPYTDTIDSLDRVGGVVYHHEGPYDATLAAVNKNKKKSPLEAVKDSNLEAIKATPPEYIQDSLVKHVPLQGTSIVPSGLPDRNGHVLYYEEGADLMREADAPGGAYGRYDFVKYHPDDLKGKGEPSYSIEKAIKDQETRRKLRKHSSSFSHSQGSPMAYEMTTNGGGNPATAPLMSGRDSRNVPGRRRSMSHGSASGAADNHMNGMNTNSHLGVPGDEGGLARSSSVSNRFADGIKRRFGSLRRKS